MTISHKRKTAWARELIQDGEKYGAPEGSMRQIKKPKPFSSYMSLMYDLIENDPTFFEQTIQKKKKKGELLEFKLLLGFFSIQSLTYLSHFAIAISTLCH
jgi:hypothetical protein